MNTFGTNGTSEVGTDMARDEMGRALCAAVSSHDLQGAKLCLASGADVNFVLSNEGSLLNIAALTGNVAILQLLLDHGADINAACYTSSSRVTPLHICVWKNHRDILEHLICLRGCDVNAKNHAGISLMHVAALNEHADLIVVLYALGATLEAEDRNERTPLHKAIAYRKFISVRRLLELNVNTTNVVTEDEHIRKLLNDHAKTPLHQREETRLQLLNQYRASVGARLWKFAQPTLVNICIAMSSLELPPYVLLAIVDWLPLYYQLLSHRRKISLIESVRASIWKLKKRDE